ncbi:MAG: S8/S53 family peptidase [Saprospiraceae bacterium]|nr:S8/S53 family peptidase [Saprospiraceae bacterium]MBP9054980.1 S8/S53 family peptidase [Saprospiraceae bacterium]
MQIRKLRTLYAVLFLPCFILSSCSNLHTSETVDDNFEFILNENDESVIKNEFIIHFKEEQFKPSILLADLTNVNNRDKKFHILESHNILIKNKVIEWLSRNNINESEILHIYTTAIVGVALKVEFEKLKFLLENNKFKSVFSNRIIKVPDSKIEKVSKNFGLRSQIVPCGIQNTGGPGKNTIFNKLAWIIDTGIAKDHPDLNVNLTYSAHFNNTGSSDDCDGHGTMIAGIIGAKDNDFGVVGISPGAQVVSVRIFDCNGGASVIEAYKALEHVISYSLSGDVLNCSWGRLFMGAGNCENNTLFLPFYQRLSSKGVMVSLAAGNHNNYANQYEPACINLNNVFTVTNMTCDKKFSHSTLANFGIPPIDYIATGTDVISTHLNGGYGIGSGTSYAAPHVAGIMHLSGTTPITLGYVSNNGNVASIVVPIQQYPIAGHH